MPTVSSRKYTQHARRVPIINFLFLRGLDTSIPLFRPAATYRSIVFCSKIFFSLTTGLNGSVRSIIPAYHQLPCQVREEYHFLIEEDIDHLLNQIAYMD